MKSLLIKHDDTHTSFVQLNIQSCTACWECIETCPKKVLDKSFLYMGGTLILTHVLLYAAGECTGCLKCIKVCKFNAISIME